MSHPVSTSATCVVAPALSATTIKPNARPTSAFRASVQHVMTIPRNAHRTSVSLNEISSATTSTRSAHQTSAIPCIRQLVKAVTSKRRAPEYLLKTNGDKDHEQGVPATHSVCWSVILRSPLPHHEHKFEKVATGFELRNALLSQFVRGTEIVNRSDSSSRLNAKSVGWKLKIP